MSDSSAASAADGGAPLSDAQFAGADPVTDTQDTPYTSQDPYGAVLGIWGFGRTLYAHHRPRKRKRSED